MTETDPVYASSSLQNEVEEVLLPTRPTHFASRCKTKGTFS